LSLPEFVAFLVSLDDRGAWLRELVLAPSSSTGKQNVGRFAQLVHLLSLDEVHLIPDGCGSSAAA